MNITGIITEYNPLHSGHIYHLQKTRSQTGADYLVVVMSGDFVQRGEPALFDKYTRTKMALLAGADLVIELPCFYACASSEYFASGGVRILDALGATSISFGTESDSILPLQEIAHQLLHPPAVFDEAIRRQMKNGCSFAAARETAFKEACPSVDYRLLREPNNILAIEYLKAIEKFGCSLTPTAIKREGNGYHSESTTGIHPSATAIRKAFRESREAGLSLLPFTEHFSGEALTPVFYEDLSLLLHTALLRTPSFSNYWEVTPDLSNRIIRCLPAYETPEQFSGLLKTKNLAETRIRRALLHLLLGITDEGKERLQSAPLYARVLGFRKDSGALLSELKKNAVLPLITKPSRAKEELPPESLPLFELDRDASLLFEAVKQQRTKQPFPHEYSRSLIFL